MRSIINFAKYLPAALCGLLIVAWVWGAFFATAVYFRWPFSAGIGVIAGDNGTVVFVRSSSRTDSPKFHLSRNGRTDIAWPGRLRGTFKSFHEFDLYFPILALLTLLFPLAIGPRFRFQFPLWSWFVWVAVLAAECVYYANS
jgi:hypothetical protein